jgi:hypothetical protein
MSMTCYVEIYNCLPKGNYDMMQCVTIINLLNLQQDKQKKQNSLNVLEVQNINSFIYDVET